MEMETKALPEWVSPLATIFIALSIVTALVVAYDIYGRGYRQRVRPMEGVWIISALWLGPFAIPLYARAGRPRTAKWEAQHKAEADFALATEAASGSLAGAAASSISHLIAVPFVIATGLSLFGASVYAMIAIILVLAIIMVFAFEHFAATRRGLGGTSLVVALVVATISVAAFDLGMVGWMLLLHFNGLIPEVTSASFLFLMQIGNLLGFAAGLPIVALLLQRGVKVVV